MEEENKITNSEETAFVTRIFFGFKWSQDNFQKLWKFREISLKQIEENQRQSQTIADERLPSWSLSLITKTIWIIFTTENESQTCPLPFVGIVVTSKSENIKKKHYAGARANIEQKPHGASLNSKNKSDVSKFVVELP